MQNLNLLLLPSVSRAPSPEKPDLSPHLWQACGEKAAAPTLAQRSSHSPATAGKPHCSGLGRVPNRSWRGSIWKC